MNVDPRINPSVLGVNSDEFPLNPRTPLLNRQGFMNPGSTVRWLPFFFLASFRRGAAWSGEAKGAHIPGAGAWRLGSIGWVLCVA